MLASHLLSWSLVTRLGGAGLTLPAATGIMAWLLWKRAALLAAFWALLFGGGLILVLATKLAFEGEAQGIVAAEFTGLSGHAMRIAAVLPVLAFLLTRGAPSPWRSGAVGAAALAATAIAYSRVAVHAHTVSETLSGWMLGLLVSALFIAGCHRAWKRAGAQRG